MYLRTAKDIGALIRDQRRKLKLDQAELADRIGVSRRWIIEIEQGKPRASIGLVLKALDALGLNVAVELQGDPTSSTEQGIPDINAVIDRARGPKP